MQAFNLTRQTLLISNGRVAARRGDRRRGLLGQPALAPGEGLFLIGTKGIHTIGLRFPLDVAFLDAAGRVLHVIHTLKPFRLSPLLLRSAMVLELPAGTLRRTHTQVGDSIQVAEWLDRAGTASPDGVA